jgi:UDP-N-acetyl-D-mannosaminuronic acid dehydrogenase
MKDKIINVIGLGYIGLPTAAILSQSGYRVFGTDINKDVVSIINEGRIHITEPGLQDIVHEVVKSGKLSAHNEPKCSDIYMICVPTPLKEINNKFEPQLSFIESAIKSIKDLLKTGDMIILESTSPVGTTRFICDTLKKEGVETSNLNFAYCPERVLPGSIIKEIVKNDRVVGGLDDVSTNKAANFYRSFVHGNVFETNSETAEMCKLTENSFRDVNIAFANELSMICDSEGIDVNQLVMLANKHPRVDILEPGPGVGGHCIAVDPWFIVSRHKEDAKLIQVARQVNENKKKWVVTKIQERINNFRNTFKKEPICACYGLSYKPNIEDCRESPALDIVRELMKVNNNIIAIDPYVLEQDNIQIRDIEYAQTTADIHIYLVKHKDFEEIDFSNMSKDSELLDYCKILG